MNDAVKHFAFIGIVVVFFGGIYYLKNNTEYYDAGSNRIAEIQLSVNKTEKDVKMNLGLIRAIEFDTDVLRSEEYLSLKETPRDIKTSASGRNDIFAPL